LARCGQLPALKKWPALDVRRVEDPDLVLAIVDDFSPIGAQEYQDGFRVFFATPRARDAAVIALGRKATPVEIDDEDWAVRSQSDLLPTTIGCVTIVPSADFAASRSGESTTDSSGPISILIQPSMGFGTGHHATTRLCLLALQTIDLRRASVLDVGTGSGILAIAATRLGAASALGLDADGDAIQSADENLRLNPGVKNVRFVLRELSDAPLPISDVVIANLTGSMLIRAAGALQAAVARPGVLILSGILDGEEADVRRAFDAMELQRRDQDGEWVCLEFNRKVSCLV